MSAFVRAFVAICLLSVFAATALLGVWSPADAKIWEGRFVAADRAPMAKSYSSISMRRVSPPSALGRGPDLSTDNCSTG